MTESALRAALQSALAAMLKVGGAHDMTPSRYFEDLAPAIDLARAALTAPPAAEPARFLFIAIDDDHLAHLTWCEHEGAVRAAVVDAVWGGEIDLDDEDTRNEARGIADTLFDDGVMRFEGDPPLFLYRLATPQPAPAAPAEPLNALPMEEALKLAYYYDEAGQWRDSETTSEWQRWHAVAKVAAGVPPADYIAGGQHVQHRQRQEEAAGAEARESDLDLRVRQGVPRQRGQEQSQEGVQAAPVVAVEVLDARKEQGASGALNASDATAGTQVAASELLRLSGELRVLSVWMHNALNVLYTLDPDLQGCHVTSAVGADAARRWRGSHSAMTPNESRQDHQGEHP